MPPTTDLLSAARAARNSLDRDGHCLIRDAVAARLRENGYPVRNSRLTVLLQALRSESTTPGPGQPEHSCPTRPMSCGFALAGLPRRDKSKIRRTPRCPAQRWRLDYRVDNRDGAAHRTRAPSGMASSLRPAALAIHQVRPAASAGNHVSLRGRPSSPQTCGGRALLPGCSLTAPAAGAERQLSP